MESLSTILNLLIEQNKYLSLKLESFIKNKNAFEEKIDFYLNLSISNDYDKGFFKAFEIMKNLLKKEEINNNE